MQTVESAVEQQLLRGEVSPLLPLWGEAVFQGVHTLHRAWRWNRRWRQISRNETSFKQWVGGCVLQATVGQQPLVALAAQLVLIADGVLVAAQHKQRFSRACFHFSFSWKGGWVQEVVPCSRKRLLGWRCLRPFSLSTLCDVDEKLKRCALFIKELAWAVWGVLKEGIALSMALIDVAEALAASDRSQRDALQEVFLRSSHLREELENNRALLLEGLRSHGAIVGDLLEQCGSRYTLNDLIASVDRAMGASASFYRGVEDVVCVSERCAKNSTYALLLGVWGSAPSELLPDMV